MHPASNLSHGNPALVFPRAGASLALLLFGCLGMIILARALPDVVGQIARPCLGCYLGAFGPPLEPYLHPFRPSEATGAARTTPPEGIAARAPPIADAAWHWLAPYQIAANRTKLFGAWPLTPTAATLPGWRDAPLRRAFQVKWGEVEYGDPSYAVALGGFQRGVAAERPPWNTTQIRFSSAEGFAGASVSGTKMSMSGWSGSSIAPLAVGAPGIDPRPTYVVGDREHVGVTAIPPGDTQPASGTTPFWRVAPRKDLERHFIQIGTYGTDSDAVTGGGHASMSSDVGANVGYHYMFDPGSAVSDTLSVHATLIHEARSLGASHLVSGTGGFDARNTFLADASLNIGETVVPSIQYFQTAGAADAIRYSWSGGRGNSAGVIAGVAYIPWSGDDSPIRVLNLRFAAHYVAHSDLGPERGAGSGNALVLSLWGALRF